MPKRGPKTQTGRAVVALNATQHGILARLPVIPGVESPENLDALHQGLIRDLQPAGELEDNLVEHIAMSFWRLRRLANYEVQSIAVAIERVDEDLPLALHLSRQPASIADAETARDHAQQDLKLLVRLRSLPEDEALPRRPAARLFEAFISSDFFDTLDISIDGIPDGDVERDRFRRWTAGLLLRAAEAVATSDEVTLDAFIERLIPQVTEALAVTERDLEEVARKLDRMRRDRLLPADARLKHLSRYEAQISRQLYGALHELEAAQARRRGQHTPIARVQVHGLPGA